MTLVVTTPLAKGGRSIVRAAVNDNMFHIPFTFVPNTAYATNGDAIATADMPTGYKDLLSPWASFGSGPYGMYLDVTNKKLKVYSCNGTGTAVEVANGTNIQTVMGTAAITIWFSCR